MVSPIKSVPSRTALLSSTVTGGASAHSKWFFTTELLTCITTVGLGDFGDFLRARVGGQRGAQVCLLGCCLCSSWCAVCVVWCVVWSSSDVPKEERISGCGRRGLRLGGDISNWTTGLKFGRSSGVTMEELRGRARQAGP